MSDRKQIDSVKGLRRCNPEGRSYGIGSMNERISRYIALWVKDARRLLLLALFGRQRSRRTSALFEANQTSWLRLPRSGK